MEKWGLRFGKMVPKVKPKDRVKTWRILTGDTVEVIDGKYNGERGKVIDVNRRDNRVVIEGVNIARRRYEGEVYNVEQGIQVSKVALLDPQKKKPTRINWGWIPDGKGGYTRTRYSKLTGLEIPKPPPIARTRQGIANVFGYNGSPSPSMYIAGQYDTSPEDAQRQTFFPKLDITPIPKDCIL